MSTTLEVADFDDGLDDLVVIRLRGRRHHPTTCGDDDRGVAPEGTLCLCRAIAAVEQLVGECLSLRQLAECLRDVAARFPVTHEAMQASTLDALSRLRSTP